MKKLLLALFISTVAFGAIQAQWISKVSCNQNATKIVNQALDHALNLEQLIALGMAKAALAMDSECGCAKILIASLSGTNANWGSRADKLKAIDASKLTPQEKAWAEFLKAPNAEAQNAATVLVGKFPKEPLFNYLASVTSDDRFTKLASYAKEYPNYASAAYNMISYGYAQGEYGEVDMKKALATVEKSIAAHKGPNALDSKAEHLAQMGKYQDAFDSQIKAVDFATFSSPYGVSAGIYWRKANEDTLRATLGAEVKKYQKAALDGDQELLKTYFSENIHATAGNSNLQPFITATATDPSNPNMTWKSFDIYDLDVYFSPDVQTAVVTFYAKGLFQSKDKASPTNYHTRASQTWVMDNGWKIMHSNFAPYGGGNGIPISAN